MRARLLAILVLVAMAGCSTPDEPQPRATTTTATTTAPPSPPAITRPLDARAYRDRVCDLLTKAQLAEHHIVSVENVAELSDLRGALCMMEGSDPHASINITYLRGIDLLGAVHRQEVPWLRSPIPFEPATVSGQPALQAQSFGDCELAIGLAETQGVVVSFQLLEDPPNRVPCARAMEFGEDIVRNLAG